IQERIPGGCMIRLLPRGHIFDFNPLLEPIPVTTPPLHEPHQALTLAPRTCCGEAKRPSD
ncbi:MAG: hypothetical protein WB773_26085, partial [Isosphaeraceae bacterium]